MQGVQVLVTEGSEEAENKAHALVCEVSRAGHLPVKCLLGQVVLWFPLPGLAKMDECSFQKHHQALSETPWKVWGQGLSRIEAGKRTGAFSDVNSLHSPADSLHERLSQSQTPVLCLGLPERLTSGRDQVTRRSLWESLELRTCPWEEDSKMGGGR